MGELLVSVVFRILNFIGGIFLKPIYALVSTIIPALTNFFSYFITFINYGLVYTSFFVKLLMIPTAPLIILVGLCVGIFAFNLTIRVFGLGLGIYKHLKP